MEIKNVKKLLTMGKRAVKLNQEIKNYCEAYRTEFEMLSPIMMSFIVDEDMARKLKDNYQLENLKTRMTKSGHFFDVSFEVDGVPFGGYLDGETTDYLSQ